MIVEIKKEHLDKWPPLKSFIAERPDCRCFVSHEDGVINTIMLTNHSRVIYVYTRPESRRAGFATSMVHHFIFNVLDQHSACSVVIEPENSEAIKLFVGCGFKFKGKDVTWKRHRVLLEYNVEWPSPIPDEEDAIRESLDDVLNKTTLIESETVYI